MARAQESMNPPTRRCTFDQCVNRPRSYQCRQDLSHPIDLGGLKESGIILLQQRSKSSMPHGTNDHALDPETYGITVLTASLGHKNQLRKKGFGVGVRESRSPDHPAVIVQPDRDRIAGYPGSFLSADTGCQSPDDSPHREIHHQRQVIRLPGIRLQNVERVPCARRHVRRVEKECPLDLERCPAV